MTDSKRGRIRINAAEIIIGRLLEEARNTAGISRMDAAKELGVSHQQLEKYERGLNRISISSLAVLADLYDTPFIWFVKHLVDKKSPRYKENYDDFILRARRELTRVNDENEQKKILKILRILVRS